MLALLKRICTRYAPMMTLRCSRVRCRRLLFGNLLLESRCYTTVRLYSSEKSDEKHFQPRTAFVSNGLRLMGTLGAS